MRINLNNTYYPKPLLNENLDDFNQNSFKISFVSQDFDKLNQKLRLEIKAELDNKFFIDAIKNGKVVPLLHLEQKTQRQVIPLSIAETTKVDINLMQYATGSDIEVVGILYCKESFGILSNELLNDVYRILNEPIYYSVGDIVGYSNEKSIKIPEDRRIGSIFNVTEDKNNILKGDSIKVSLSNNLIDITLEKKLYENFTDNYKRDPFVKKLVFSSVVIPALVSAYTEMFYDFEAYEENKWCVSLADIIEKDMKLKAEEIFTPSNYESEKVYHFANLAMGDLYKDAINYYHIRVEEGR